MKNRCVVVTNPMVDASRSPEVTLSKFLRVITPAYDEIQVLGGNLSLENDLSGIMLHSVPMTRAKSR